MGLRSRLFFGSAELQACLVKDAAHVTPGTVGEHVQLIQRALCYLGEGGIAGAEYREGRYGTTTAAAVLRYKQKRNVVNRAYQSTADNIVGKMTIQRLDTDMLAIQDVPPRRPLP